MSCRDIRVSFRVVRFGLVPSVVLYGQPYRFPYVSVRHTVRDPLSYHSSIRETEEKIPVLQFQSRQKAYASSILFY